MPMTEGQRKNAQYAINRTFMWSFKKGDNIVYNLDILWSLYGAQKVSKKPEYFNKPIIIIIASIIECIVEDLTRRIQQHSNEPVPNITREIKKDFKYTTRRGSVALKQLKQFNHYIDMCEKHKIFGEREIIYSTLNKIRDIRNRVHIQNHSSILEEDEIDVFTDKARDVSEMLLSVVILIMIIKYPRPWPDKAIDDKDFPYPFPVHSTV